MNAPDTPAVAPPHTAIADAERFLAARDSRVGLDPATRAVIARAWSGPGTADYAHLTEATLRTLIAAARERVDWSDATQETTERCAHCGKPITNASVGNYLGAKVCHTGTLPPYAHPTDCYRLLADGEQLGCRDLRNYRDKLADRLIDQHRAAASLGRADGEHTTPPTCPGCGMPETNCCCG